MKNNYDKIEKNIKCDRIFISQYNNYMTDICKYLHCFVELLLRNIFNFIW
jgi:hypothetical protein